LNSSKTSNKTLGDLGEGLAVKYLMRHGYRILVRKYRCPFGEIDIVAQDKDTLVFVEVRSKCGCEFGLPYETISRTKKGRLEKVALAFQKRFNLLDYDSRFDCVSILFDDEGKAIKMELFKDAFWT